MRLTGRATHVPRDTKFYGGHTIFYKQNRRAPRGVLKRPVNNFFDSCQHTLISGLQVRFLHGAFFARETVGMPSGAREAPALLIDILLCDGHFAADAEGAAGDF